MCEHSGWTGQREKESRTRETNLAQDDPRAPFDELMMIEDEEEEARIAKPESLVEVECAGYVAWQDMKECAPITMLDMEVFLASLKESRR